MGGRDTTSGELLWSVELDAMFASLHHAGERVVVELPPVSGDPVEPWVATGSVPVLDAGTGDVLLRVPTVLDVVHVG